MNGATNRKFWNFLEYKLRGSQNRCFALPNFSFGKTTLNNNIIMPNFYFGSSDGGDLK